MHWRRPFGQWVLNRKQPLTTWSFDGQPCVPLACANCEQPSSQAVRCVSKASGASLLVPYCSRCHKTLEAGKTRIVLAVCGALLAGLGALLAIPLCGLNVSAGVYALTIGLVSSVPLLCGALLRPQFVDGQTSADVAVWFNARELVGTNIRWMQSLALGNNGHVGARWGRTNLWRWPTSSVPALFVALAFAVYGLFYPTLVVLNLSPGEFDLWVDGEKRVTVGVSSLESADAARRLALPAGYHRLEAKLTADGELVQAANVYVEALGLYLFAPGASGQCFWTEVSSYGKHRTNDGKHRLGAKDGFIALPRQIDSWFTPNPAVNQDRFSSGGEMVALRHGPCAEQR